MPLNIQLLQQMMDAGYINIQQHPHAQIYIYNYSQAAQYNQVWNEITLICRGLILDENKNIIARPFNKFFNLEELQNATLPNTSFEVYDKMDGSLGILYWLQNKPYIATRGSFTSDQAIKASEILHQKYTHTFSKLDKTKTYLFEIIYPQNRIVLDYGTTEDIILLAIIDTQTGTEEELQAIGFTCVKKYDGINDLSVLKTLEQENREGFVVKYKNGYRLKVKFAEYVHLHKIVTQISNINIWEHLRDELAFTELLEKVPDEFFNWVKQTIAALEGEYLTIENICKQNFKVLDTKKETALYYLTCPYSKVLFLMHDNKKYNHIIWNMIKPKFSKPFQIEENKLKMRTHKPPQILILVGPPGAGKSTFSKAYLVENKNWIRINRDDFREMQFAETRAEDNIEMKINIVLEASIESLLLKKVNVLIDATHCRKEYITQYIKRFGHLADISFKLFDEPLDVLKKRCLEREAKTGKHIPEKVLEKIFSEFENLKNIFNFAPIPRVKKVFTTLAQDEKLPTCFLCDLDGTIAQAQGRNMFNPSDAEVMSDLPIWPVIKNLKCLAKDHTIIFVSGREDSSMQSTKKWIEKYMYDGVETTLNLLMRKTGDFRRDAVIKKEILHTEILPNYHVLGVFDDRLQVVRECWNAEGIFCFNVNQTLEEF